MTIEELLQTSKPEQLIGIRDRGYMRYLIRIDEDLCYDIPEHIRHQTVKNDRWGYVKISGKRGDLMLAPCHYVDL